MRNDCDCVASERVANLRAVTVVMEYDDGTTRRIGLTTPNVTVDFEREPRIDWPASRAAGHIICEPGPIASVTVIGHPVGDGA